jgi:phosphoinositide-3-kinase regulatory subunit 4
VRHAFIVTGGSDKKLRFWDLSRVENSCVYSGLGADESRPTFTASHPTSTMTLNTEKVSQRSTKANNATSATAPARDSGRSNNTSSGRAQPRSTVISVQQQQLLRSHLDSIMDVAVLEVPYGMSVSVDRLGVIFVFR